MANQSEPNHLHLIAADAPIIDNSAMARRYRPMAPFAPPTLPAALEAARHSRRNYADARSSYFDHIVGLVKHR